MVSGKSGGCGLINKTIVKLSHFCIVNDHQWGRYPGHNFDWMGGDTKSWLPVPDLAGQPQGIAPTGLLGLTEFGFGMTRPFRLKLWGLPYKKTRRC